MGKQAATLGELKGSGYEVLGVKAEMRRNLIAKLRRGDPLFPGIVGYDETVIPQIANAILGGQDIMMLGERGQAKSRVVRGLADLLDDEIPIIRGPKSPKTRSIRSLRKVARSLPRPATTRPSPGCRVPNAMRRSWPPRTLPSRT